MDLATLSIIIVAVAFTASVLYATKQLVNI